MAIHKAVTISVFEFLQKFQDESSAVSFVETQLWPRGPVCPHCKGMNTTPRPKRRGHHCNTRGCGKDFTVRIGTVFEKSKISLKYWLYTIYLMETSRKSISSLQLSKELGIEQRSAWFMLHRLREACITEEVMLDGIVEIDETMLVEKKRISTQRKRLRVLRVEAPRQRLRLLV